MDEIWGSCIANDSVETLIDGSNLGARLDCMFNALAGNKATRRALDILILLSDTGTFKSHDSHWAKSIGLELVSQKSLCLYPS